MKEKLSIFILPTVFLYLLSFQLTLSVQARFQPTKELAGSTIPTREPVILLASPTITPTQPLKQQLKQQFLPLLLNKWEELPILPAPLPLPIVVTSNSPVDFLAAVNELKKDGLELGYNKIGFHTGFGGNRTGLLQQFQKLDAAGVPIFIKAVDLPDPVFEVQELAEKSGVPHIMVYRKHGGGFELPNYDNDPIREARIHYERHVAAWPKELDPTKVWMETLNEPDKNRSEWLAIYSLEVAKLAVADNRKVAAFSWSSGEPEVEHWEGDAMLEYLRYAALHKENVAVALHEYSFVDDSITRWYPWLVGRFQFLFEVVDKNGIGRPTVLITEWGWAATDLPGPEEALEDILWANQLYNAYPEVLGAGLWYLGGGFGGIANKASKLVEPIGELSVTTYYGVTPGIGQVDASLFYSSTTATRQMWVEPVGLDQIVAEAKELKSKSANLR